MYCIQIRNYRLNNYNKLEQYIYCYFIKHINSTTNKKKTINNGDIYSHENHYLIFLKFHPWTHIAYYNVDSKTCSF